MTIGVRDALAMRTVLAEHLTERWYIDSVLGTYISASAAYFDERIEPRLGIGAEIRTRAHALRNADYETCLNLAQKFQHSLRVGEVYTLSDDMMTFAVRAGEELPNEFAVEPWLLHAQHGFLVLPRGLRDAIAPLEGQGEDPRSVAWALSWHHGTGSTNRDSNGVLTNEWRAVPGVEINLWGYWHNDTSGRRFLGPAGSDFQPYGMPTFGYLSAVDVNGETITVGPPTGPSGVPMLSPASRLVFALQMLMRQELPALTRGKIPKQEMRGIKRLELPPGITVIELRRRAPSPETGTSGRHLTHRHYVRGTWAAYWVGPSHAQHPGGTEEKVRIYLYRSPHVRGPEDAPFAPTPDRVHAIRH